MDSDPQADKAWLLSVQRKLYQWSQEHPGEQYRELWNWITDIRNLRYAWHTIASNKGKRTAGIDGATVGSILRGEGSDLFLGRIRRELRDGSYRPSPSRRKMIPKLGKPGKFRPLGIPTVRDRVVQCAIKQVLEPIFEAQFWHVSYGFRPGRSCHGALEHIRMTIRPRATSTTDGKRHGQPYQWVIEGDIKGCFDNLDHHVVMERVRTRIADRNVNRVLTLFLKAGVLSEDQFIRTDAGTPQGGVVSPLLANIALSAIEERYERWVNHQSKLRAHRKASGIVAAERARTSDRRGGRVVLFPIRYADDFVILVSGRHQEAPDEKQRLEQYLRESLKLELSAEKTLVTSLTAGFEFLGHRVRQRMDHRFGYTPRIEIPKPKSVTLRQKVKALTRRDRVHLSLSQQLQKINPTLRGWANFYRYCTNAKSILNKLDRYVGDRLWRWMRYKHPKAGAGWIARHRPRRLGYRSKVWRDGRDEQFLMASVPVQRYRRGWMRLPDYAMTLGEPDA